MLVKFEQNRMVHTTTRNCKLFDKKKRFFFFFFFFFFCKHFWQSADAVLEDVSVAKTIVFDSKILISRLRSFRVPKITVVWHMQPG